MSIKGSSMYFVLFEEGLNAVIDDFFALGSYFFGNVLFEFFQELVNYQKSQSREYMGLILQERLKNNHHFALINIKLTLLNSHKIDLKVNVENLVF